jgi:hypothetical protein
MPIGWWKLHAAWTEAVGVLIALLLTWTGFAP